MKRVREKDSNSFQVASPTERVSNSPKFLFFNALAGISIESIVTKRVAPGEDLVKLNRSDVVCLQFDVLSLVDIFGEANKFQASYERLPGQYFRHVLGVFKSLDNPTRVVFAHVRSKAELVQCIDALLDDCPGAFALLTPTSKHVSMEAMGKLAKRQCIHLGLDESLKYKPKDGWKLTVFARKQLANFYKLHRKLYLERLANTYPTPAGTCWTRIRIRKVDFETMSINANGVTRLQKFTDMGLQNRKSAKPNAQFNLLLVLAQNHGVLTWKDPGASNKLKKQVQLLNEKLMVYFQIDTAPIIYDEKMKGYRTLFAIDDDVRTSSTPLAQHDG